MNVLVLGEPSTVRITDITGGLVLGGPSISETAKILTGVVFWESSLKFINLFTLIRFTNRMFFPFKFYFLYDF